MKYLYSCIILFTFYIINIHNHVYADSLPIGSIRCETIVKRINHPIVQKNYPGTALSDPIKFGTLENNKYLYYSIIESGNKNEGVFIFVTDDRRDVTDILCLYDRKNKKLKKIIAVTMEFCLIACGIEQEKIKKIKMRETLWGENIYSGEVWLENEQKYLISTDIKLLNMGKNKSLSCWSVYKYRGEWNADEYVSILKTWKNAYKQ